MKDAKKYEKVMRKLLAGAKKAKAPAAGVAEGEEVRLLVRAVLEENSRDRQTAKALDKLESEFVDFNELRVSPSRDVLDCLGEDFPFYREKSGVLFTVLNAIFSRFNVLDLRSLGEMKKREIKRYLQEFGLTSYSEAVVSSRLFDIHAVPVDQNLVDILKMKELVHPETDVDDTRAFLERIVLQNDRHKVHAFLRSYMESNIKPLLKKRAEEAERRAREEAEAAARAAREAEEAEAKKKAEEKARAKAEAEKQKAAKKAAEKKAAAEKAKKKKAKKKKAAKKKKTSKKAVKKKAAKKATAKTVKKKAKKAVKKKATKKTTKKKAAKKKAAKKKVAKKKTVSKKKKKTASAKKSVKSKTRKKKSKK